MTNIDLAAVGSGEQVARYIYTPYNVQSITGGRVVLKPTAFPTEELAQTKGKSLSVDRVGTPESTVNWIELKCNLGENPSKDRSALGYCLALVDEIRSIKDIDGNSVFDVIPDPIKDADPKMTWDDHHARIIGPSSKGRCKQFRGPLMELFEKSFVVI